MERRKMAWTPCFVKPLNSHGNYGYRGITDNNGDFIMKNWSPGNKQCDSHEINQTNAILPTEIR